MPSTAIWSHICQAFAQATLRSKSADTGILSRKLSDLVEREFEPARQCLELALRRLDADFLASGEGLEKLLDLSGALVNHSQLLLKMSVGQEGGESIFEEAAAVLLKPLEFADEISCEWPVMLGDIQRAVSDIARLKDLRISLDRTVSPLDVLQRMFRIECSSLDSEIQALFATLTAGMQDVRLEMFGMIESKFSLLEASVKTLSQIEWQLKQMIEHAETARLDRLRIRNNLDQTRQQLTMDLTKDVALSGVTRNLQANIAEVVTALQAQDLINQRTRHVMELIGKLGDDLRYPGNAAVYKSREAALIAGAQITAVSSDLDKAKSEIAVGLKAILALMQELDREVLHLSGVDLSSTAEGGLVQTLLETGEQARAALHNLSSDASSVFETLRPISNLVGNLSADMASISQRMRLIALNTQIQSAHAGMGTGLDVLATRAGMISDETAALTTEMSARLQGLKSSVDRLVDRVQSVVAQAAAESATLDQKSVREETILHAFRDKSLTTLAQLDQLGEEVQRHVEQMCATVAATADIRGEGARMRNLLAGIAAAAPVNTGGLPLEDSSLLDDFRNTYSMASERVLHDRLLGSTGETVDTAAPNGGQIEEFEHSDAGNIDFF